jgi:hypothetical protein
MQLSLLPVQMLLMLSQLLSLRKEFCELILCLIYFLVAIIIPHSALREDCFILLEPFIFICILLIKRILYFPRDTSRFSFTFNSFIQTHLLFLIFNFILANFNYLHYDFSYFFVCSNLLIGKNFHLLVIFLAFSFLLSYLFTQCFIGL